MNPRRNGDRPLSCQRSGRGAIGRRRVEGGGWRLEVSFRSEVRQGAGPPVNPRKWREESGGIEVSRQ